MEIDTIKELVKTAEGMKLQIGKEKAKEETKINALKSALELTEQAQIFLQKVAKETQSQLKLRIEDIVNLALETCFPSEYTFRINFNISRGKTEAELVFEDQKTGREIDPINASGGGVVDLTAFALRIASYTLERNSDNVIILDEPFRFLSRDLQSRAGEIIKTLSEKMGLQIILVTHIPELIDRADSVFEVKKQENGVSQVKKLSNKIV